uniref:Uncharacterized protein n=1 Tax=Rhipicephalus microplus TaxID=6941 RepID=A0A6G5A367_RHIMP
MSKIRGVIFDSGPARVGFWQSVSVMATFVRGRSLFRYTVAFFWALAMWLYSALTSIGNLVLGTGFHRCESTYNALLAESPLCPQLFLYSEKAPSARTRASTHLRPHAVLKVFRWRKCSGRTLHTCSTLFSTETSTSRASPTLCVAASMAPFKCHRLLASKFADEFTDEFTCGRSIPRAVSIRLTCTDAFMFTRCVLLPTASKDVHCVLPALLDFRCHISYLLDKFEHNECLGHKFDT